MLPASRRLPVTLTHGRAEVYPTLAFFSRLAGQPAYRPSRCYLHMLARVCEGTPGVTRIVAGPGLIIIGTTSGGPAFEQVRECARALPFVRSAT